MGLRIRAATQADSRQIAEVHIATWKSAYARIISKDYLDSLSVEKRKLRWDAILQSAKEKEANLVAEIEGRIAGFISVGPNRAAPWSFAGEIFALYVDSGFQKKGMGAALFREGKAELRKAGFESAIVWVLRANPSRYFYEKMGGRELEEKVIRIGEEDLLETAYGWEVI